MWWVKRTASYCLQRSLCRSLFERLEIRSVTGLLAAFHPLVCLHQLHHDGGVAARGCALPDFRDLRIALVPTSFLIDHRGRICYSVNRAIDWNDPEVWEIINGLLAKAE